MSTAGSPRQAPEGAAAPSRADAQRARVIAASVEIFGTRGYRATSMNEIAAGVGLSKPTLYHYFRNKEELLVRIYSEVLDQSVRMAVETVAAAPTPFAGLHALLVSRVVHTCENKELLKICFEEEDELRPELAAELLEHRRRFEGIVTATLERHLAAHPEITLTTTPTIFVNMCLGAVNWTYKWFRPTGSRTPAELGRDMADALLASITP